MNTFVRRSLRPRRRQNIVFLPVHPGICRHTHNSTPYARLRCQEHQQRYSGTGSRPLQKPLPRHLLLPAIAVTLSLQESEAGCEGWQWRGLPNIFTGYSKHTGEQGNNPYTSAELRRGLEQRKSDEKAVQLLRSKAHNRMALLQARREEGELTEEAFLLEVAALKEEVLLHAQRIFYGVNEPHAREKFLEEYGCVAWSDEIMRKLSSLGKIVEIGAGHGQWQRELAQNWGADILAFDVGSRLPLPRNPLKGQVHTGDERMLLKYPERTLLLVYPPPGLALSCLQIYKGEVLVYVGEGEGGVNGTEAFFKELRKGWVLEETLEVQNFPKCFEKVYIVRRR